MSLVFMILIGMGFAVIMSTCWNVREAWSSRSWVTTQGTICKTTIDYQRGGGLTRQGKKKSFFANVIYRYVVNDKAYTNDQQCYGNYRGSEARARTVAAYYREGSEVEVVYNPQSPKQSVLEPGLRLSQCLPIGIGVILMGGGWLGLATYGYPVLVG